MSTANYGWAIFTDSVFAGYASWDDAYYAAQDNLDAGTDGYTPLSARDIFVGPVDSADKFIGTPTSTSVIVGRDMDPQDA